MYHKNVYVYVCTAMYMYMYMYIQCIYSVHHVHTCIIHVLAYACVLCGLQTHTLVLGRSEEFTLPVYTCNNSSKANGVTQDSQLISKKKAELP